MQKKIPAAMRLDLQPPGFKTPRARGIAPPVYLNPCTCTPNPAPLPPPARAWAERHHPGVVGEAAAGCIPSVPPVGGWGRLGASSWPQIRRWDRRRCCWRISGPPAGRARNPLDFVRWVVPTEAQLACVFMSRTGRPSARPQSPWFSLCLSPARLLFPTRAGA
jgi:hypothetical protein